MGRTYNLSDPYDRMLFRELMLTNWCQKKFKPFVKQMAEIAPYCDGETLLFEGLCYQHGWGVWRNKDTARQYFSKLQVGKTVWFGHYVGFMECEIVKIEEDRILLREKRPRVMNTSFTRFLTFPPKEVAPWDSCLARKWMNTSYYENTFYGHERKLIQKVRITTPGNPYTGVKYSGKECEDKVFPLSLQEYMDYKGMTGKIANRYGWTFTLEGPEAVCVRAGEYVTRITTREASYNLLAFDFSEDELGDMRLKGSTGSVLRTPGSSADSKVFVIKDLVFYEGETRNKVRCSKIELGYQPAFWVSLK